MWSSKRPVTPSAGELKAKRPKKKLIFREKLEIVKRFEGAGPNFIAKTLQLPQSTVFTIIKQTSSVKKAGETKKQKTFGGQPCFTGSLRPNTAVTGCLKDIPEPTTNPQCAVSTPSERLFVILIMPKPKNLACETVAQIIGLTGAGPTSVKCLCADSGREAVKSCQLPNIALGGQGRLSNKKHPYSNVK
ncbi:hypothetical protein E2C01_034516 [Portunus trituberculatus]|uniref:HTH psq-type domain-containing protein n=1 Tax=Portunus trituberculatus TaxID=210409 RepID=A0A5B7F0T2_PORTR|nr:hypothetical protein [Portunus trituberculatus]